MNNAARSYQPGSVDRLAVDLDDLESQLRQFQQSGNTASRKDDPLAELARLVGRDDPIKALLAAERPQSPGPAQSPERHEPSFYAESDDASSSQAYASHAQAHQDWYAHDYDDGRGNEYQEPEYDPAQEFVPLQRHKSRKGLYTVAAILGASVIGVGGALAWRSSGQPSMPSGEVPVITAQAGPSKVAPDNPGGVEIPNQNKQIYEKTAFAIPSQTKVVDREEQPMDVGAAARAASSRDSIDGLLRGQGATPGISAPVPARTAGSPLGEPKKVRTIAVRPDGTIMTDAAGAAPQAQAQQVASLSATPAAPPKPTAPSVPAVQSPVSPVVSTPPADVKPQARPLAQASAAPLSITPSATPQAKLQQRVASIQPTALPAATADQVSSSAASSAALGTGGYVVQLAARPSEKDAMDAFAGFQKKYPDDLGGMRPIIRKADVGEKTIYRLRVGTLSRDDATSLCQRLQTAGAQCFVAKN